MTERPYEIWKIELDDALKLFDASTEDFPCEDWYWYWQEDWEPFEAAKELTCEED